jgi:hypothetical protein
MEETITISVSEFKQLKRDSKVLTLLRNGGVDSWEWYEEALQGLDEED